MDLTGQHLMLGNSDLAAAADVGVHIVREDGREALISSARTIDLSSVRFEAPRPIAAPEDLRRIRDVDPRRILGDIYNAMVRRLR